MLLRLILVAVASCINLNPAQTPLLITIWRIQAQKALKFHTFYLCFYQKFLYVLSSTCLCNFIITYMGGRIILRDMVFWFCDSDVRMENCLWAIHPSGTGRWYLVYRLLISLSAYMPWRWVQCRRYILSRSFLCPCAGRDPVSLTMAPTGISMLILIGRQPSIATSLILAFLYICRCYSHRVLFSRDSTMYTGRHRWSLSTGWSVRGLEMSERRAINLCRLTIGTTLCCHVRRRCSDTRRGLCDSSAGGPVAGFVLCRRRIQHHDHIHQHPNTRVSKAKTRSQTRSPFHQLGASRTATNVAWTPQAFCTPQYHHPHAEQWPRRAHKEEAHWARRHCHERSPGREGPAGAQETESAGEIAFSLVLICPLFNDQENLEVDDFP